MVFSRLPSIICLFVCLFPFSLPFRSHLEDSFRLLRVLQKRRKKRVHTFIILIYIFILYVIHYVVSKQITCFIKDYCQNNNFRNGRGKHQNNRECKHLLTHIQRTQMIQANVIKRQTQTQMKKNTTYILINKNNHEQLQ
jgi:heme/copper-type cytochrome/quinol oxidase subunit 2